MKSARKICENLCEIPEYNALSYSTYDKGYRGERSSSNPRNAIRYYFWTVTKLKNVDRSAISFGTTLSIGVCRPRCDFRSDYLPIACIAIVIFKRTTRRFGKIRPLRTWPFIILATDVFRGFCFCFFFSLQYDLFDYYGNTVHKNVRLGK